MGWITQGVGSPYLPGVRQALPYLPRMLSQHPQGTPCNVSSFIRGQTRYICARKAYQMTEEISPFFIHRPTHYRVHTVVCATCRVRWPCLAAQELASKQARLRAAGDTRVLPWWFIPIIAQAEAQPDGD